MRPNKLGFVPAFFLVFFGTFILIIASYLPIALLLDLCFPEPEAKPAAALEDGSGPKDDKTPAIEEPKKEDDKAKDIENDAADNEEKKEEKVE